MVYNIILEKVLKFLRIAGGQFSRQKPRKNTLSKIRQKILNMSLHHREPGSEAAKKFDNFDVFWDTLNIMLSSSIYKKLSKQDQKSIIL